MKMQKLGCNFQCANKPTEPLEAAPSPSLDTRTHIQIPGNPYHNLFVEIETVGKRSGADRTGPERPGRVVGLAAADVYDKVPTAVISATSACETVDSK